MIKLIVDSAADIGKEEADRLGIIMIPMVISFDDQDYLDGVNLSPTDFFNKLIECKTLPKTSQINPFRFEELFEQNLVNDDDQLLVITISSKLSGTYQNALTAAANFNNHVHVIDSLNACIGERLLCLYALSLIKKNYKIEDIINNLEYKKTKIKLIALLGTLEYLKKGGRISGAVAFAGELISLKPVVGLIDGEVKLICKAIGSKKGNKLVNESNEIDFSMPFGTLWSGLSTILLDKYIKDSEELWKKWTKEIPKYQLGATIGTHIGPGAVGVAFFEK